MNKHLLISTLLISTLGLVACDRVKTETKNADANVQSNTETASVEKKPKNNEVDIPAVWSKSYKMELVNEEICQPETDDNIANCIIYDVQSVKTNLDWVNQYYDKTLKESYADTAFGPKSDVRLEGEESDRKYYEGSLVNYEGQKYNLVTFSLFNNSYTGGAHNNFNLVYDVFDIKTQKKLTLADVLKPVAKDKVLALLKKHNSTELEEYKTDLNTLTLTENFYFGDYGLVFVYSPYEIAPWVFGSPELTVPYDELRDLLKSEYYPDRPDYRISQEFS